MTEVAYRDRTSGRYPISLSDVRSAVNILFGEEPTQDVLNAANVDPVLSTDHPAYDPSSSFLLEGDPEFSGGNWRQTWGVMPLPWRVPTPSNVDIERDRRINGGFRFAGTEFQTRPADRENILGAVSLATLAITLSGKRPGDLRWHGGGADFAWIAADNSLVMMDAPTVIAFGQAAAEHKSDHTFAARALKDAEAIPVDFFDDKHWPSS